MTNPNLAKNTTYFTIALAAQKALSFLYFVVVARVIGVDNTGKYSLALGFSAMFAMFLDFGTTQVLIRESARNGANSEKYLSNVVFLKLAASLFVYASLVITVNLMGYPDLTKQLIYIAGLVMLLDSFSISFYGVLRGLQNLKFESIGIIANQTIVLIFGFLSLWLGLGLKALIATYLIGSASNFLISFMTLRRRYNIRPRVNFDKSLIKEIIKIALPFAIAGFFIKIYSSIDIILLSKMTNDRAVGLYSVAYKVTFALQFIGTAFSASLYPAFCNYFVTSKEKLASSFVRSIYYLTLFSLPLSVGTIMIAPKVIGPVFGAQYVDSIAPLGILMLSLIFVFLSFPLGAILNASNKQSKNTINLAIITVVNIILNIVLIPVLSYNGAAIAVLASYFVLVVLGFYEVNRILQYDKKYLLVSFLKVIFASALMGLSVFYLRDILHFIPVIVIAIGVFFLALIAVKGLTKEDINQVRDLILKKT